MNTQRIVCVLAAILALSLAGTARADRRGDEARRAAEEQRRQEAARRAEQQRQEAQRRAAEEQRRQEAARREADRQRQEAQRQRDDATQRREEQKRRDAQRQAEQQRRQTQQQEEQTRRSQAREQYRRAAGRDADSRAREQAQRRLKQEQDAALKNLLSHTRNKREQEGLKYAHQRMRQQGWQLENASLHYRGNQGVDMIYTRRAKDGKKEYAIVEAKAGAGESLLKKYNPAIGKRADRGSLQQGTHEYNMNRLRRFQQNTEVKDPARWQKNKPLVEELRRAGEQGRLKSFAAFEQSKRLFEIPKGYGRVSGTHAVLIP